MTNHFNQWRSKPDFWLLQCKYFCVHLFCKHNVRMRSIFKRNELFFVENFESSGQIPEWLCHSQQSTYCDFLSAWKSAESYTKFLKIIDLSKQSSFHNSRKNLNKIFRILIDFEFHFYSYSWKIALWYHMSGNSYDRWQYILLPKVTIKV